MGTESIHNRNAGHNRISVYYRRSHKVGRRNIRSKVLGNANERELGQMQPFVQQINELEREYEKLSDAELANKTVEFFGKYL